MSHRITYANAWVLRVDGARRRLRSSVALVIAIATTVLAMTGSVWVYGMIAGAVSLPPIVDRAVQYLCVMALFYVVAIGMLAWERRGQVPANAGLVQASLAGALVGVLGFALAAGGTALLGGVVAGADAPPLDHRLTGLVIGAGLMMFQVYGEELFFRGWLQANLATRWGPWIGVCCTALLFAAAHAIGKPISPLALTNDALAGLVFGLLAMRSGGLAAPVLAHLMWNWIEGCWVGLSPNPGVDPLGSLFDYDLAGPAWLSGGPDALNGAVATTLALVLMIAATLVWRPSRRAA